MGRGIGANSSLDIDSKEKRVQLCYIQQFLIGPAEIAGKDQ